MTVPKAWFTHLYIVGALCGMLCLVHATTSSKACATSTWLQQLLGTPQPAPAANEPHDCHGNLQAASAVLYTLHSLRRVYECFAVHRFSPTARMHVVVYLEALAHYAVAAATMWMPYAVPPASGAVVWLGYSLCVAAMWWQHNCHKALAAAGRDAVAKGERYGVPRGWGFGLLACPHYTAELLLYISWFLMSGAANWHTLSMLLWVASNLVITSLSTLAWYRSTFKDYPRQARALIPYTL